MIKHASSAATTSTLTRLEALPLAGRRLEVDRHFPGRIRNVSILTTGPALGHEFEIDKTTVEQVVRAAPGMRGRWTHGGLCEDGLGRHLGAWENLRLESFRLCRPCEYEASALQTACPSCLEPTSEEWRAVGDFQFARSAHQLRPDGLEVPAPEYLMDRAYEDPRSLGISIVARFAHEEQKPEGESGTTVRLARIVSRKDLRRGDWVADPAANPVGLHAGTEAPSELAETVTRGLDQVVARLGVKAAKVRALAFLARYFKDDLAVEGELDGLEAEVATLREQVATLEADLLGRQREEDEAYLEALRAESAAAQAPIPAEDMERVSALLREGQRETARVVGEAFLERSRAKGQAAYEAPGTQPLTPRDEARRRPTAQVVASLLRRRGFEPTQDGKFTRVSPSGSQS